MNIIKVYWNMARNDEENVCTKKRHVCVRQTSWEWEGLSRRGEWWESLNMTKCATLMYENVINGTHGSIEPTENLKASHQNMGFYCTWYSTPQGEKNRKKEQKPYVQYRIQRLAHSRYFINYSSDTMEVCSTVLTGAQLRCVWNTRPCLKYVP